jgi:hypothetical protein
MEQKHKHQGLETHRLGRKALKRFFVIPNSNNVVDLKDALHVPLCQMSVQILHGDLRYKFRK